MYKKLVQKVREGMAGSAADNLVVVARAETFRPQR